MLGAMDFIIFQTTKGSPTSLTWRIFSNERKASIPQDHVKLVTLYQKKSFSLPLAEEKNVVPGSVSITSTVIHFKVQASTPSSLIISSLTLNSF